MKKNILVIGAFGYSTNQLDGQTVKTRNVYELICKRHVGKVSFFDTLLVYKKPWLLLQMLCKLVYCNTLILLPATNNLSYLFPSIYYLSKIFKYEIVNICIGGWQIEYFLGSPKFGHHPNIMKMNKRIRAFLPEMTNVDEELKRVCGFKNTSVFPNFRKFSRQKREENAHKYLKMVFMARINRRKGYDTIFNSLPFIRRNCPGSLIDFYGPIATEDKIQFERLVNENNDIVTYKGQLDPERIYQTLSEYDVLLLPTQYYTEGFPGSILDAYISGIPVIVTEWKHAHEFVDHMHTGIIIPFEKNQTHFNQSILYLYNNKKKLIEMKDAAFIEANKYSEDVAWNVLKQYL